MPVRQAQPIGVPASLVQRVCGWSSTALDIWPIIGVIVEALWKEGTLASSSSWIKRFIGDPCDEILRNHSKGSRKRFYTLWAECGCSNAVSPDGRSCHIVTCDGNVLARDRWRRTHSYRCFAMCEPSLLKSLNCIAWT